MANQIKWSNALSNRASLEAAVAEVVERAQSSLGIGADLGLVFISSAYASEYPRLMPLLQEKLQLPALIGCGGGGIIGINSQGEAQEVEGETALSLTLMHLPGVEVSSFHISADSLPDMDSPPDAWVELIDVPQQQAPQFILLSDAFTSKINDLLEGLDFAYPGSVKVGGLASSGATGMGSGLFCNYKLYREGTVGVALTGNIAIETIVAQGCRPIGRTYQVTKGDRNIILEVVEDDSGDIAVANKPSQTSLEALRDVIENLSEADRQLAQHSLFIGVAQTAFKQQLGHGDFLIRNLLGVDPRVGAVAIGDRVRTGQRIQFHLRDAETSAEDLELLLQRYQDELADRATTAGALMFSCMGRGEGLYGQPNFDSRLFRRYLKDIPIGGFFCNGEIGPIGSSTFLHGYTSVFGICRQIES
ncbi:MAG TPA: FIST N-terminal domain-containing protein [Oculatellaceae cyanobacterium]|jgi:small ligand-binding sensory domain FIST